MFQTLLQIIQAIGFCVYAGVFFSYAIRLIIPHELQEYHEETLRSFQKQGIVLGLGLGLFIYSSIVLQYLQHNNFHLPNTTNDILALLFFFLAWVHNTYIEIWGLEDLRKSGLDILSQEERNQHKSNMLNVRKNVVVQGLFLLLSLCFHTL